MFVIFKVIRIFIIQHFLFRSGIWCLDIHPNSKNFASVSPDSSMKIWQIDGDKPQISKKAHEGKVYWVKYSRNGEMIATAGADHTAKIWDVKNFAKPLYTIKSMHFW